MKPLQIISNIYLGNIKTAADKEMLREYGIVAVVNASNEDEYMPRDINYLRVNLDDSDDDDITPWLDEVYEFIDENQKEGGVLIHCQVALCRSPCFIIAYLAKKYSMSVERAESMVRNVRPIIDPRQKFLDEIQQWL
ncbi:MAG: dual specificity protein phosphatase 1B [Harvfovirus sp.]|uniref:protein-serine/threonine phosphatase n=1 Tax=Harvfovirus sp. TaxID=2487768 RepID=A0A3G5A150_9VIRU|nr:MAG: dual specificity protein phosphatase 1B [Harvfovirus sp.]